MDVTAAWALVAVRIVAGLVVAGHGAQKLFGAFEGPGLEQWTANVHRMGFAQPRLVAVGQAFVELFGGLLLAIGLYTPVVAALLTVNMLVAMWKVHLRNGPWVTKGGYEYALILAVVFAALGLAGMLPFSVDAALGLAGDGVALFVGTAVLTALVVSFAVLLRGAEERRTARG